MKDYILNLIKNIPDREIPITLDIVMEGGAYNGYYGLGSLLLIKELEKKNYVKINRFSGASIGAIFGALYLIDELDKGLLYYERVRGYFKKHLNLKIIVGMCKDIFESIPDEKFEKIRKNKLFLTFYDKSSLKQRVVSTFKSKRDIINKLICSAHIPFITTDKYFYEYDGKKYIDGGCPFIFTERYRSKNEKILYISLINLSKFTKCLQLKNEVTPHGRMLEGILDAYNFFSGNTSSMCSYVDEWSIYQFLIIRGKEIISVLFIYSLLFIDILIKKIFPKIKSKKIYNSLSPIFLNFYRDFMLLNCF